MLLCILLIPLLAALDHPLVEVLSDFGVDDVADVLPGHLADLLLVGEAVFDVFVFEAEVEDGVQGEALIMWDGDMVDLIPIDRLQK